MPKKILIDDKTLLAIKSILEMEKNSGQTDALKTPAEVIKAAVDMMGSQWLGRE